MTEATLTKKKTNKPTPPPARRLSVQATDEWIGWVERLAIHYRTDVSKLVDMALAKFAKDVTFEEKPPKRVP